MRTNTRIELFIRRLPLVAAALFIAALCTTTNAGMEPKSMEVAQPEPFTWTGFYFGLNAGVVLTNFDVGDYETVVDLVDQFNNAIPLMVDNAHRSDAPSGPSPSDFAFFSGSGHSHTDVEPMVGFDLGYMKQWGHFVVGGSIGFSGTHTETSTHASGVQENFFFPPGGLVTSAPSGRIVEAATEWESRRRVEQTWSGYVGGQLGYAMDRWLFYATGGAAFAQIEVRTKDRATTIFFQPESATSQLQGSPFSTTDSLALENRGSVQDGWFAGAGVKFAFASNMAVGMEFRHAEFGDETYRYKEVQGIFPGRTPVCVDNNEILVTFTWLLGSHLHK